MNAHDILPLFVGIPLGAGFLLPIIALLWKKLADILSVLAVLALVVMALHLIGAPSCIYAMGKWPPPFGVNLVLDPMSAMMVVIISAVSLAVTLYSVSYVTKFTSTPYYYSLLMLMIAGMNGVVLTGDLFNMFVFMEIGAIASYGLVAFGTEHEELEASFKYLVLGSIASSIILFGIALLYSNTGALNLADLARIISATGMNRLTLFVSALFLMGFGLKAALVPFHAWLPDAHTNAPAPISAMLSGLLIKAMGVYAIVRLFYHVFGLTPGSEYSYMLIGLGLLSMVVGVILAVGQWDMKRLLAYHSISQMGYVMLGIGLGTPLGLLGGLFHLLNHSAFKSLLFLCSGSVEHGTGTRQLKELGGLCRKMPVTSATCSVASLSISGVPPFNGFWSKLIIVIAVVQAAFAAPGTVQAGYIIIAAVTVLVSFLTLVSFVKVQKYSLFGALPQNLSGVREVSALMCIAMIMLAVACIGLGIMSPFVLNGFVGPARDALMDGQGYIRLVLGG
jgi:multicomponent Na+:H+ antiporter subunit D